MDLAGGHTAAVDKLLAEKNGGIFKAYNLGTGSGVSVLEVNRNLEIDLETMKFLNVFFLRSLTLSKK